MSKKTITLTLLAVTMLGLIGWDIYAVAWGAPDAQDSISRSVLQLWHRYPAILLPIGFVLGHLFWRQLVYVTPDGKFHTKKPERWDELASPDSGDEGPS